MIAITNEFAHPGSRHLDEFLSHEHRHLTRLHVLTLAALAVDCSHRYLVMIADRLHDFIKGEHLVALLNLDGTLDDTLSQSDIDAAVIYDTVSQQTIDGTLEITHTAVAGLCDEGNHILRNLQSILAHLVAHDIDAEFHIRLLQLRHQSTRETGDESVWHILEFYRRAITRQNDTLSVAEEVIEDVEEGIQGLRLACPILHIIHDEHIDRLVEIDEIIARIMQHRIGILCLEEAGTDIEHTLLRIHLLGFQTDGIHQVSLSATRRTIDEHRIELRGIRMLSDRQSHRTWQLVAVTLHIIIEGEFRIKLGVNVFKLLWFCRVILYLWLLCQSLALSLINISRISFHILGQLVLLIRYHPISETDAITEIAMQDLAQQANIVLFQVLIYEWTWNLNQQSLGRRLVRLKDYWSKPCIILLL